MSENGKKKTPQSEEITRTGQNPICPNDRSYGGFNSKHLRIYQDNKHVCNYLFVDH